MRLSIKTAVAALCVAAALPTMADEPVDLDIINRIRDEGFNHSEVMATLEHLSDRIGPRLTGSPGLRAANDWTMEKLTAWGLENARLEGFEFGPGWSMDHIQVMMTAPRPAQLYAMPISWHPGTEGVLEAEVIFAPMKTKADFEKYKGMLKGKLVLVDGVPAQKEPSNKIFRRRTAENLTEATHYNIPKDGAPNEVAGWSKYISFQFEMEQFIAAEGGLAIVRRSPRDAMLLEASGYQHQTSMNATIPGIRMAAEHYGRIVRLLEDDGVVKLSLDIGAKFHAEDTKSYSTIAEIPGKGRNPEIVLAGAHLDSWFLGDGAADNGAGTAVVMEAVRILKVIGVKPKRTIRVGLWGGEEQGYYGSYQYVLNHLATRPRNPDEGFKYSEPYTQEFDQYPVRKGDEYERFSAYFNLDNGAGKVRGIYAESNSAAAAVFADWLKPFHDLGAETVTLNATGGTDHEVFDDIGLPGFQFIQDPLDYGSRLHHTQVDTFDHVYEADLKQASVIMASFLYNAAMREERFPRKPEPTAPATAKPVETDD